VISLQNILNSFHLFSEEEIKEPLYKIVYTHGYEKELRRLVKPKDREKIEKAIINLTPLIRDRKKLSYNSPLSIYDWHQFKGNPDIWDFHVGAYTIIIKYDNINSQARVIEVKPYTQSMAH
jgi:mRNA-degrading endonuclease RelE of RelBE toxin-antitoxin system